MAYPIRNSIVEIQQIESVIEEAEEEASVSTRKAVCNHRASIRAISRSLFTIHRIRSN